MPCLTNQPGAEEDLYSQWSEGDIANSLEPEQFGGVVPAFLLAGVKLCGKIVDLELPFSNNLVESLLFLFGSVGNGVGAVHLQLKVFHFCGQTLLGLLQRNAFLVEGFDRLLGFCQTGLELPLGFFEFLRASHSFGFVFLPPELGVSVGFAELTLEIGLGFGFLFNLNTKSDLFTDVVQVMFQVAEFTQKSSALASFLVGQPLRVLQLSGQGHLDLAQLRHLRLGLLQLPEQIGVLDGQLLLGSIEVVEGAVGLVQFGLDVVQLLSKLLGHLLDGGLNGTKWIDFSFNCIYLRTGIIDVNHCADIVREPPDQGTGRVCARLSRAMGNRVDSGLVHVGVTDLGSDERLPALITR
nr:unnamed protein product [Callosobruchus analis]